MNDSTTEVKEPLEPDDSEETFCVGRTVGTMFDRDVTVFVVGIELENIPVENQALSMRCYVYFTHLLSIPLQKQFTRYFSLTLVSGKHKQRCAGNLEASGSLFVKKTDWRPVN